MTNPRCKACGGWGFTNKIVGEKRIGSPRFDKPVMEICSEPYKRGVCTPRTTYIKTEPVRTARYGAFDDRSVQLPSDKRRAAREAKRT